MILSEWGINAIYSFVGFWAHGARFVLGEGVSVPKCVCPSTLIIYSSFELLQKIKRERESFFGSPKKWKKIAIRKKMPRKNRIFFGKKENEAT